MVPREVEGDSVVVEAHQGDEVVQVVVSEEVVGVTRMWLFVQIFGFAYLACILWLSLNLLFVHDFVNLNRSGN